MFKNILKLLIFLKNKGVSTRLPQRKIRKDIEEFVLENC